MDGQEKFWVVVVCVVVLAISALLALTVVETQRTERLKFSQGYEQVTVTGTSCPVWQKARLKAEAK